MAKSGIKSGLRSARKHHIINNNNNNETIIPSATILPEAQLKIKQEPSSNEEFKEYAETAMNELLGWYGYGSSAARDNSAGGIEMARLGSYSKSNSNSNSSSPVSPLHASGCGWCGKSVDENNGLLSGQSSFCSELCFSQSRRANFKRNKTCDWCRHVRHTVSYVDFQEGSAQLQFCSDKCLNQYKMHIFCRETQAHLEFHPHLIATTAGGASAAGGSAGSVLITPDLWLRDCKTPPEEDAMDEIDESMMREECTGSPLLIRDNRMMNKRVESPAKNLTLDKVPKLIPIITLAPTSSLLASPSGTSSKRFPIVKKTRNKRKRFSSATITSRCALNTSCLNMSNTNLDEEVPQDLRMRHNVTPPARMLPNLQELNEKSTSIHSEAKPILLNHLRSSLNNNTERIPFQTASPNDLRLPDRYQTNISSEAIPEQNKPISNISMIPPVTVLVPYPIMIPVPIPIPIPLPVSSFLTAYFGSKATDGTNKNVHHQEFGVSKTTADTNEKSVSDKDEDGKQEVASSTSGVDEEIVVDVVKDEPKSPRMLRRRKKMLGMNSTAMENKGDSSAKVIKRKI